MQKEDVIRKIIDSGLVAVIRAESAEKAAKIVDSCIEGGVAAIELTFTVPFAHNVIEYLAKRYSKNDIILGAGTVLDPETARVAILSGAQYIVSPCLNLDVIRMCNRYSVPAMPGIMTITEAVAALEAGADILKLFPGEFFGPKFIKAIKGPLPKVKIMPTGGVNVDNTAEWISAGAVALGAGSALTAGGHDQIVATAKEFIRRIKMARGEASC